MANQVCMKKRSDFRGPEVLYTQSYNSEFDKSSVFKNCRQCFNYSYIFKNIGVYLLCGLHYLLSLNLNYKIIDVMLLVHPKLF